MKKTFVGLMACACLFAQAVESAEVVDGASSFPTPEAREQERARLDAARQQLETQYNEALKQCYQQFDVTSCRLKARDRRIEANRRDVGKPEVRLALSVPTSITRRRREELDAVGRPGVAVEAGP